MKNIIRSFFKIALAFCVGILVLLVASFPIYAASPKIQQPYNFPTYLLMLYVGYFGGFVVHLIVHEAGHLVFGLLTGYKFCSFRIFSFMWERVDGKLRLKRFGIPGTAGQCLMAPPELVEGGIPITLYNLGGIIFNLVLSACFLGLYWLFSSNPYVGACLLGLYYIGILLAFTNGFPMKNGGISNDGYNTVALKRHPDAVRSFWIQMKVNELITRGEKISNMPDEWFEVPNDDEMKNSIVAVRGVLACNRLMEQGRFPEAEELMAHLLAIDSGIVGLHRSLIICDRIFLELIGENRPDIVEGMLTAKQKKLMTKMKTLPSVLRTEFAIALLHRGDVAAADFLKEAFEKCAENYPYPLEIETERGFIALAEEKSK